MAQGRELTAHRSSVHEIREQLLDKIAHVFALRIEQCAFVFFQEVGELPDVGGIGRDGERSQTFLDFQIVEEAGKYTRVGFGGHLLSMRVIGRCGK